MTQLSSLRAEVILLVDDDSVATSTIVDEKLNEGLGDVAGRVLLPDLETNSTVDTDTDNNVSMPDDYHRHLSPWAHSTTHNRRIKVYKSLPQLLKWFSTIDLAGNVVGVAKQGTNLYYQRIPSSAETIMLNYFKYPTTMSADDDEPDCLPAHLHSKLLVNYACWELFKRIEDGVEGEGSSTARHEKFYLDAVADLIYFVGPTSDMPDEIEDELFYDDLANL